MGDDHSMINADWHQSVESPVRGDAHAGFGGRVGETRCSSEQWRVPARPNSSALLFVAAIALPALGYWRFGLNPVLAFWIAYVLTRPLGASFADWFGVSRPRGGLALGPGPVSLVLGGLIAALVIYLARTKFDTPGSHSPRRITVDTVEAAESQE